jgi:hypothetical protein
MNKGSIDSSVTHSTCLSDEGHVNILKWWILLNNCATLNLFCNRKLVVHIRPSKNKMTIHCNAGVTTTNLIADLPGFGEVWFSEHAIANILSLSKVKEKYRVTFDSNNGNLFVVHKPSGQDRKFKESRTGLYYWDTKENKNDGQVLVSTVEQRKDKYTNRAYLAAEKARKLQDTICRPSTLSYLDIVKNNLLLNNPVTREDIIAAEDLFGTNLGSLKGKTVRRATDHVASKYDGVPRSIMELHRDVTLAGDLMFVNQIGFFMSISRAIKFGTAEMICNRKSKTLLASIKAVQAIYYKRGFRIRTLLMDNEFEPIRGDLALLKIELNVTA